MNIARTVGAITAAGAMLLAPVVAHAEPLSPQLSSPGDAATAQLDGKAGRANYVSLGDSYAANAGRGDTVATMGGCPNSARNYSALVGHKTGLEVRNFSCNGTLAYSPNPDPHKTVRGQINNAVAQGALDGNTRLVTITAGANDVPLNFLASMPVQDGDYNRVTAENVNIIKRHAPNATIQIVGYPTFVDTSNNTTCPVNVAGAAPRIPASAIGDIEGALQNRQRQAAANSGARFVDMKQVTTAELGMCGKDGERHVSALIDGRPQDYTMPIHPTYAGSEAIANQIVANR